MSTLLYPHGILLIGTQPALLVSGRLLWCCLKRLPPLLLPRRTFSSFLAWCGCADARVDTHIGSQKLRPLKLIPTMASLIVGTNSSPFSVWETKAVAQAEILQVWPDESPGGPLFLPGFLSSKNQLCWVGRSTRRLAFVYDPL